MVSLIFAASAWSYGLKSLALPGWGQLELGQTQLARAFLGAEAVSALGAATSFWRAGALYEASVAWAYSHAGADPSWGSEYWQEMEIYYSYEEYLEDLWRQARRLYPDDPEAQESWVSLHALEGRWEWSSETAFKYYQNIRSKASFVKSVGYAFLGALAANHIVSAAEAFFGARAGVSVAVVPSPGGFSLKVSKSF